MKISFLRKHKKISIIITISLTIIATYILSVYSFDPNFQSDISGTLLIVIIPLIISLFVVFYIRRHYNLEIIFMTLCCLGILLRIMLIPGAGVLILLGFSMLATSSLLVGIRLLFEDKEKFIKWFSIVKGIVLFICSLAFCFKFLHLPGGSLLLYLGSFLLILTLIGFIFRLPNSNYINWNNESRKLFYRTMVIPICFVVILCSLMLVFNETWTSILTLRSLSNPWRMLPIDLLPLEGI